MSPATWPRDDSFEEQLLVVDDGFHVERVKHLIDELRKGDLVIVNDAATVPASLHGTYNGQPIELRLLAMIDDVTWRAVLFGAGDWHTRTEHRPEAPEAAEGGSFVFSSDFCASVVAVDATSKRLVTVRFDVEDAAECWAKLYATGKPVQYAHVARDLELWHVQTAYAGRPWAVELCSAGRPLRWPLLQALRARGVELATLTHAAGLSSTGDDVIDAALPFPERYDIPAETVAALARCQERGGRVIAIGTTVVRALEGCAQAHAGEVVAGEGVTSYKLGPHVRPVVVDALFTGMHDAASSHFQLLQAFADLARIEEAYAAARALGFLEHEFGDSCLIWKRQQQTFASTDSASFSGAV